MKKNLRILALNWRFMEHPEAGGSEINIFEQARRWAQQGHQVTLLCADSGRKFAPQKDEVIEGIQVIRRGNRFTVYLLALVYYLLHARSFDYIVDVSNGIPFFTPLVTRIPGVLIVHHVHGLQWFREFPYLFGAFGWFLESRIVPRLYRNWPVVAVSPTTRDGLIDLGFKPSSISVVYNGINAPAMIPVTGHEIEQPKTIRIAYVGRLKRYKRIDRLVRLMSELRELVPGVHLDIAGDGDARPEIEILIKELHLQDDVTLYGFIDEATKVDILSNATVFATPSMNEGWGLSVIEANVYGCPAVAFDVPGLRVSIRNGETGLLAQDDASFRDAIVSILLDTELRSRLSDGARKWAEQFDWDESAEQTLEIMENGIEV
jgi:glycosyltransferase involved in cell wall biosynthesis